MSTLSLRIYANPECIRERRRGSDEETYYSAICEVHSELLPPELTKKYPIKMCAKNNNKKGFAE
jgi:hypothetical protein